MWSSSRPAPGRRRVLRWLGRGLLLAGLPPALGGCGLRPLYGDVGGAETALELAATAVAAPKTRLGRILENQLVDDLNPAGITVPKRYHLDIRLQRTEKALAIQLDESVTRYDLTLAAFFALYPVDARPAAAGEDDAGNANAAPLYRSAVRRVASYNVIREPFATLIAEQDAERRAAVEVSREIRTLLAIHFENGGR